MNLHRKQKNQKIKKIRRKLSNKSSLNFLKMQNMPLGSIIIIPNEKNVFFKKSNLELYKQTNYHYRQSFCPILMKIDMEPLYGMLLR